MNVGKTKEIEAFMEVVDGLCELRNDYIKFPTTVAETTAASIATFTPLSNLPNIAGAIDGAHIKIKVPKDSAVDYFSRYQHDVVVQAVVNGKRAFMDVAAGFPGACMMLELLEIAERKQSMETFLMQDQLLESMEAKYNLI